MLDAINFTTSISDLYDAHGNRVAPELGRGVYRDDTGELISICGRNHKTVDHMEIVNPILDHYADQGYSIHFRDANHRALYDLKGKKGIFVNASIDRNGALMRTEIIAGDFIVPKSRMTGARKDENTMFNRITLLNAHDGSLAVSCNTSYLRLVCLNGMTSAEWSAGTRAKHTVGLDIESLKARIRNSLDSMGDDAEKFGLYASTKVTVEQAAEFFRKTIARLTNKATGEATFSEPLVHQMLANFKIEDKTVWGVWNAMTAWATHGERRTGTSGFTTLLHREQRVAAAMKSKEFAALTKA